MKYYIIAGEASGDLHAGNLIRNLKLHDSDAVVKGFGGDKMKSEGASITVHYDQMAFMGAFEVVANYKKIKNNFRICKADILDFQPDAVILVDYAGFNLRMAKFTKKLGMKTLFYISPKVWAWKKSRVKKIKTLIDQLYLILPFEKEFFSKHGYNKTYYVGNPLTDAIADFRKEKLLNEADFKSQNRLNEKPIIALLSGSRKQEIKRCLPEMLKVTSNYPEYQFVVAGAPSIQESFYNDIIKDNPVTVVYNQTYQLLSHTRFAVVTSGTATLETALFRVPQIVIYKFNTFSFIIFKPFIWIKFFSLVNIILDKFVVKEFLQFGLARKIKKELDLLVYNKEYRDKMLEDYDTLIKTIGEPGTSERAAKHMINFIKIVS
ncbi:MAG: lipid-A-disaccharide synthase [Bacteroidales bacterium]|nr:lipid-A-disaccharide synthase [Bacteroidales bacterium]MBN2819604.1 lipid-A-disaccharide synthase [Bacteroidales bacterium]